LSDRVGLLGGAAVLLEALRLLRARRELWAWCALPMVLNIVIFAVALLAFLSWGLDPLTAALHDALDLASPAAWYGWIWTGPLRALAWLARWLILALVVLAIYLTFTLVGGVLASPILDGLSRRVERIELGGVAEQTAGVWRGALRALVAESKRTAFFLGVQLAILALGLLPGLQPVALVAALGFAALYLPLDYTGYVLDRRATRFRTRRIWVWRHRSAMLGFGVPALLTFFAPGLNFLCLPWLVTAGTLLALRIGPPDSQ
jgi:CysZ protein